jgi:predicted TIM-barrel fold metal-dependent hydrolase
MLKATNATLLIGKGDWEGITATPPMQGANVAGFKSWTDEKRKVEPLTGNKDVFGDGSVTVLRMPMYEPFWAMAEALDFSIGFHEGSTTAMPTVGVDRFEEDRAARHMVSHTMEMMLVALSVIWGGVVDRHPRLRVAFLESGGGWIAPWLDRMDRHFDDLGFNETAPKMRPSELFQRNCWISFEPVESSIAVLADYIGPHKILWATDYPHSDGFFPGAPQMLRERLGRLSPEARHQVLAGGALGFYGLSNGSPE